MAPSDTEIIENIRTGATQRFALLVHRYEDRAMTLAVRMLRNRTDAEEAVQDAFVKAYHGLGRFQGASTFGTWFYRIVYNVCLTRLGQRKSEFHFGEYDDNEAYDGIANERSAAIDADFERRDMVEFIRRAIELLPPKYATILSLFYFQELSHEEICSVTHLPLGTVKVHLFRARAMLQQRVRCELHKETPV